MWPTSRTQIRNVRSPTRYDPTIISKWDYIANHPALERMSPDNQQPGGLYPQVFFLLRSTNDHYKDIDMKDVKMQDVFVDPLVSEKLDLIIAILGRVLSRQDLLYGYEVLAIANRKAMEDPAYWKRSGGIDSLRYALKFLSRELSGQQAPDLEALSNAVQQLQDSGDPSAIARKLGIYD